MCCLVCRAVAGVVAGEALAVGVAAWCSFGVGGGAGVVFRSVCVVACVGPSSVAVPYVVYPVAGLVRVLFGFSFGVAYHVYNMFVISFIPRDDRGAR